MTQDDILEVEFKMLKKWSGVKPNSIYVCECVNERGLMIKGERFPPIWLNRAVEAKAAKVFRIVIRAKSKKLQ